jgi:hypothetical protein
MEGGALSNTHTRTSRVLQIRPCHTALCIVNLQVETIEFALQYSASLAQGYTATTGTENFAVAIPRSKFVFGYPAQPQASTTGFIDPTAVTAMVSEASIHTPLRFDGAGLL